MIPESFEGGERAIVMRVVLNKACASNQFVKRTAGHCTGKATLGISVHPAQLWQGTELGAHHSQLCW